MQLEVKTVLNRIQHFVGFVYQEVRLRTQRGKLPIEVKIEPHQSMRGRCSECRRPAPGYDRLPGRPWLSVPMWGAVGGRAPAANSKALRPSGWTSCTGARASGRTIS